MLLFHQSDPVGGDGAHGVLAVFGVGLIGSAVTQSLAHLANWHGDHVPLSWDDVDLQRQQLDEISCRITTLLHLAALSRRSGGSRETCGSRLQVLWSAGRAGFGSTESDAAPELNSFAAVADCVQRIAAKFPGLRVTFHHISSAGGLFEGQRRIVRGSIPSIRRPYGKLKLGQEAILEGMEHVVKRVYRLTSIIGPATGPHRRGLVGKLIDDGIHHRTTCLVGQPSTLRDYVWHSDIGRYVAECILDNKCADASCTHVLASAKPSSIFEVIDVIESLFGRRLYTRTSPVLSNDADTTVSHEVLPPDWCATDLFTCVSRIYRDALAFDMIQTDGEFKPGVKVMA
jgi:hypothetical protein